MWRSSGRTGTAEHKTKRKVIKKMSEKRENHSRKFRNHISVIVEQTGGFIAALVVLLVTALIQNIGELEDADLSALTDKSLLIVLGILALLVICLVSQILVWSRTYISIEEQAVVIERGRVNKKKNTISIRNISNINVEQNLFEMLMGTCKVKMDTNSRSTADSTDVKIVLKKADALWFKREVTGKLQELVYGNQNISDTSGITRGIPGESGETLMGIPGSAEETAGGGVFRDEIRDDEFDLKTDIADILRHGFFSISVISVLILLLGIAGAVMAAVETLNQPELMKSLIGMAAGIIVSVSVILSALWDTVKDFIRYYHFRVARKDGRLYIRYGFLKRVEYTIPVDKIQALKIHQSFVARMGHRYMAEIVNIGMGDEKEEQHSFLLLYCGREKLREYLEILLPEFAGALEEEPVRLPGAVWAAWSIPLAVTLFCLCGGSAVWGQVMPRYAMHGWICAAGIAAVTLVCMILKYHTDAVTAGQKFLVISRGYFGRQQLAVRCRDIQYAEFSQNFVAKACKIKKGEIHLLASSANTSHHIPYFRGNLEETIKRGMLAF